MPEPMKSDSADLRLLHPKENFGIGGTRLVSLVDGLAGFGLSQKQVVQVLVDEFGMDAPGTVDAFFVRISQIRAFMESAGIQPEFSKSSPSLQRVLVKVVRRQIGGSRARAAVRDERTALQLARRGVPPDYSKHRRYPATPEELSVAGVNSVDDLVDRINAYCGTGREFPITQFDFPSTRKKFYALVRTLANLDDVGGSDR